MRAKGWSRVQASSAAQMRSNPNAYFYRHVAPGQTQVGGAGWRAGPCWLSSLAVMLRVRRSGGMGCVQIRQQTAR